MNYKTLLSGARGGEEEGSYFEYFKETAMLPAD